MKDNKIQPIKVYSGKKEFNKSKKMEFCQNGKYLGVYGKKRCHVIDVDKIMDANDGIVDSYDLEKEHGDKFIGILDI